MALVINDRVKESSSTTGTGTFALAGIVQGFETFSAGIGNNNETYYAAYEAGTNNWEVGRGTLDGTSANLARTEVLTSSNSDNLDYKIEGKKYSVHYLQVKQFI